MDLKRYREVIPNQANQEKVKDIVLNTGGSQSTLQDIKVSEHANGYCYKYFEGRADRNRFIYWRSYNDVLELSEVSLDVTLTENHVRYRFNESPVLSVHITERGDYVVILVTTVNSLHRLYFQHPEKLLRLDGGNIYRSRSIFKDATAQDAKDPTTFFVFGQHSSSSNHIPHSASCWLSDGGDEAYFALAHNTSLVLYTMNCEDGQTVSTELRQNQMVPRILTNFAGALRGKNTSDGSYVNSMIFKLIDGQLYLYALYRDDQIRMWSVKRSNCVASVHILQDYGEQRIQGSQCDTLCSGPDNSICAFLNFSTGGCEFKTFETFSESGGHFTISLTSTIPAPQYDLIDYQLVKNRIWALWCNSDGDFDVSTICLNAGSINWVSVALEMPPDQADINANIHARQEYCSYIFSPGRFQAVTIAKALVMFRRSNIPVDADLPMYKLKERVCQAIECEMQNEIKDLDVTDEEYIDINLQLWERFYSCCEQYHLKATQPIGLVSLDDLSGMCIVKKNMFSLIRPCELVEHVMLSSDQVQHQAVPQFGFQDRQMDENLAKLIGVLGKIDAVLPSYVKLEIYNKLMDLQMPSNIISDLVRNFLSLDVEDQPFTKDFIAEIRQKLLQISDVPRTMSSLLECLQMNARDSLGGGEHGVEEDVDEPMDTYAGVSALQKNLFQLGNLFCSTMGKSFVAESLKQIIMIRFALCRNLLILQHLLSETFSLSNDVLKRIQSDCSADASVFLQAYFVMKWICVSPISMAQITANQKNDSMSQTLQGLQLYETFPKQSFYCVASNQFTLFEYFLHGKGSIMGLTQLAESQVRHQDKETLEVMRETANWECTLNELLKKVGQLIWPMSGDFVFGEWLIGTGQCIMIEEYVRLNGWCQWNRCSRDFILAVTMLNNGELYKAFDYFMSATSGVCSERFLLEKILGSSVEQVDELRQGVIAQYYMKVLQMFEQKPALDCVIRMAKAAIEILSQVPDANEQNRHHQSIPRKAMFQSIVFMNQLKLEHYEEAYDSLINNVEEQRRKEGLRQLVVCLFQKRRLDLLMHFPYVGLQSEFEQIVEQRARSMGVEENVHYKFLYAHHVTSENMRKAAFCMYEQAMRLQLECDTVSAMQARYESLLACINALHLVDEKYQFIAKPVVTRENIKPTEKLQVEVLEIKDVKRELVHTEAILCLHRFQNRNATVNGGIMRLDAQELLGVLSSAQLFTMAVRLADAFQLSKVAIIKALTATCIDLSEETLNRSDAWNWLQENNVTDLPASNSVVDTAWNLLERLIRENEKEEAVELKRAAVEAILSSTTAFVPRWLLDSMRRANANALLHLFVKYGRLVEASEYAVELVWAMLGRGHEYFGLHNPLLANGAALCFPVNTMDLLIYNLRLNVEENADKLLPTDVDQLKECLKSVRDVCDYYRDKALEVSLYKAKYEKQIANRMET